jgi:hypothetical protein
MAEYICGFEYIREPDDILPEGSVVDTHTHNHHHNTHLTMGLWEVHRYQPILDGDGKETGGWVELPVLQIQGGGPRSIVPIPANMKHKFILLQGPGFYRCVFSHRDMDGNIVEGTQHYTSAYV